MEGLGWEDGRGGGWSDEFQQKEEPGATTFLSILSLSLSTPSKCVFACACVCAKQDGGGAQMDDRLRLIIFVDMVKSGSKYIHRV